MVHHSARRVVDLVSAFCYALKEVALLATKQALTRATEGGIKDSNTLKETATHRHIAATRYATRREGAYLCAEVHGVGYGLLRVARHPARSSRGVLGDNLSSRSHGIGMSIEEFDVCCDELLDNAFVIIYKCHDVARACCNAGIAGVRQPLIALKDVADIELVVLLGKSLHALAGIVCGVIIHNDALPHLGCGTLHGNRAQSNHELLGAIIGGYDKRQSNHIAKIHNLQKFHIFAPMKYNIVIFDLDGTLLNTIGDLAASVDYVMRSRNLPEHTDAEYRQMVGGGIKRLVERALPAELTADEAYVEECVAQFRRYYVDNIDRHTVPYDGMCELLHRLRSEGVQVAVASNKFQHGTDRLVAKFFGDVDFVAIEGNREGAPLKPDPQIVNNILAKAGVEKQHAVMIGDSGIDIRTAAAAGIDAIGVAWGFRFAEELYDAGAECVVTTVAELEAKLFAEA